MASPWVERNNNYAQYPQPRGSQYEGPNASVCACDHCHVLSTETFCETCWITCYDRGYADGRIRFTALCTDCETPLLASEHEQGMTTCVDCQVELAEHEAQDSYIHGLDVAAARARATA